MTFPDTTFTTGTTITSNWLNAVNDVCNNSQSARNVVTYGAVGDGITDDTVAIQNAINAVDAAGGGYLIFNAGTYLISSTLTLIDTTVILQGQGQYATTIKASSSMSSMILVSTTATGSAAQPCGGVCGMYLNGNSFANIGLQVSSVNYGIFENLNVQNTLVNGILHTTTSAGPSSQHNHFQNIRISSSGSGAAFFVTGTSVGSGNASLNEYENIYLLITNNDGMYFGFCDGNTVIHLRIYRGSGTGRGVVFAADDTGNNRYARTNMIYNVQAGNNSGIYALAGTGVQPSGANFVQYNSGNGGSKIVVETGAVLGQTTLREGANGTFTPTIGGATTAGTQTYTKQLGWYTLSGDRCHFTIDIELSAIDAATAGNLRIFGLPFSASNDANMPSQFNVISRYKLDLDAGYTLPSCANQASTTWLNLWQSGDNVDSITLKTANLLSDSKIHITGSYVVFS